MEFRFSHQHTATMKQSTLLRHTQKSNNKKCTNIMCPQQACLHYTCLCQWLPSAPACPSWMANYLDKVHGEQSTKAATCRLECLQMTNARGAVQPRFSLCFPLCRLAPHLSMAASTWGATVVFTNLPKIATCLRLFDAASAGEEHLFWTAGASVITLRGGSGRLSGSQLIMPHVWLILTCNTSRADSS